MSEPPSTQRRRAWLAPCVVVAVASALVYAPIFAGKILFFRDLAHWIFPARTFLRDAWLRGELPAWNPDEALGFSVFGSPLYGVFYPANLLYLLGPVGRMVTWSSFLHMVWGGAGVVLLAQRFGASRAGAAVAGLAFALGGFSTSMWNAGVLLLADAWVPWCGVGFVALAARCRGGAGDRAFLRGAALAALPLVFSLLLGEIFVAMMAAAFGLATAAVWRFAGPGAASHPDAGDGEARARRARELRRLAAGAALALAVAAECGAAVVFPARMAAGGTARAQPMALPVAESGSLHPLRLVELAAPGAMGDVYGSYPGSPWAGDAAFDGLPLTYSVYVGGGVLALALLALGRGRRAPAWLAALALLALVIALGRHTPVHRLVRTLIPPLAYMRYPEKYLVLFTSWLAVLSGLGATRLLAAEPGAWRRPAALAGLLAALAALTPVVFAPFAAVVPSLRAGLVHGALAAGALLAASAFAARRPSWAAACALLGVVADLALAAWPLQEMAPAALAEGRPRAAAIILADHASHGAGPAPPRLYRANKVGDAVAGFVPAHTQAEVEWRFIETLVPNTPIVHGIASLPGYDAAIPTSLSDLWALGQVSSRGAAVLRLLATGYALLPVGGPRAPDRRPGFEPLADVLPGARLYRVVAPLPRVYLAGSTVTVADDRAFESVLAEDVLSGRTAVLGPGDAAHGIPGAGPEVPVARACRLETFTSRRVVARCDADRPALAVFVEQFAPGWTATLDGAPVPLLRVNLVARGVPVGRGRHEVELRYDPPGLLGGGLASLLGLAALAVMALLGRADRA